MNHVDPVAQVEEVERTYVRGVRRVEALRGVSMVVAAGEMVALVGPSGCGKSTLLNLLSGVDRPDAGRVVVAGIELARASEAELLWLRRHAVGVVFQSFHLMPNLTAAENVSLPLALAGDHDERRVRGLLERVGLAERADHYPAELSGGEEQRVAIARALVHRPSLVVADEPTGNLDQAGGERVLTLLAELRREEGAALVLATHDAGVAATADRVVTMRDGRMGPVDGPGS